MGSWGPGPALDCPCTALHARVSSRHSADHRLVLPGMAAQHSHGRWKDPALLQGTSKRAAKPLGSWGASPREGLDRAVSPHPAAVPPLPHARLLCSGTAHSSSCVGKEPPLLHGREAANPSFQAAGAVEGGERKEGVGWGMEKSLLGINSSRLGLLASHAVNPF